ncbi:putative protein YusI [Chlamydiales bacterium STE3]|nr:putative protein YusI [Chlamydiales bacterium STE3]
MIIYLYSRCSTCQKAVRFLKERNISFEQKEIVQEPPSKKELLQMLSYKKGEVKKLFNTSGLLYRELQLSEKLQTMDEEQALALLGKNGMLVKRPFLLGKDFGLTGFNEKEWVQALLKGVP